LLQPKDLYLAVKINFIMIHKTIFFKDCYLIK